MMHKINILSKFNISNSFRIKRHYFTLYEPVLDPVMGVNEELKNSKKENPTNLVIGAYRRDEKPHIFESVKEAKNYINKNNYTHEYLPITGDVKFNMLSKKLYFTDEPTNCSVVQTLSGTGSLYLLGKLLGEIVKEDKKIYIPNPTWDNHFNILSSSNMGLTTFEYLQKDRTWNFEYLIDNIKKINDNNIILLHGCAHNPSGYDPSFEEWKQIIELCIKKNLLILIDMAYLGFASGNIIKDNAVLRIINNKDYPVFVCSSYAKNFGLYSERVGNLFFRGHNDKETKMIEDILRIIIRKSYSSPPSNGSNIISYILSNDKCKNLWKQELVEINSHYCDIRKNLRTELENRLDANFSDITEQKGMFWYSKLTKEQVKLFKEQGIFFPDNGRISIAGFNKSNIINFADTYKQIIKM
jgi:aspartate/tyrosine/aromatic aminotransferase